MPTIEEAQAWYPADDPVHGFDHVLRVHALAQQIGRQLGADLEIVQAAALLHDAAGAAPDGEGRADHEQRSADFAREVLHGEGWPQERIEQVVECILSHRYRTDHLPQSLEAQIVFDADKLDVLGAFGAARTIGYALQAGQPVFAEPSAHFLETGEKDPGEPHSAYHEYLFKLRHVATRLHTEPARQMAQQRERVMRSFFEQLAAEARGEV